MSILSLLPALTFLVLLLVSSVRHRKLVSSGNLVIGVYCLTSLLGLALVPFYPTQFSIAGTLVYTLSIAILLMPFVLVDFSGLPIVSGSKELKSINIVVIAIALFGTASFFYWIPYAVRAFLFGIGDYRNIGYSEDLLQTGQAGNLFFAGTGLWEVAVPAAAFVLWRRGISLLGFMLVLAVLSRVVVGFAAGGRLGLMLVVLGCMFCLSGIGGPSGALKKHKFPIVAAAALIGISGLLYSIWAADKRDLGSVSFYDYVPFKNRYAIAAFSVVHYAGQNLLNFQDFWSIRWDNDYTYGGGFQFPLVFGSLERLGVINDYSFVEVLEDFESQYTSQGLYEAVFCTFLRDAIMDFGWMGAMLIICGISIATYLSLNRYRKFRGFEDYLMVFFLANYSLNGWASNHLANVSGNATLLSIIGAYVFLRLSIRRGSIGPGQASEEVQPPV